MTLTVADFKRLVAALPPEHDARELVFAEVSGFEDGVAVHVGVDGRAVVAGEHRGHGAGTFLVGGEVVQETR